MLARKRRPTGFDLALPPKPEMRASVVSLLQAWRDAWVWGKDRTFSIDQAVRDLRVEIRDCEWNAMLAIPRTKLEPVTKKRRFIDKRKKR